MWLVVVASIIVVLVIAYFISRIQKLKVKGEEENYRCKDYLLTKTEKNAFDKINQAINSTSLPFVVFPKVRLMDFIWTSKEDRNAFLKIQSKFVDFLVLKQPHLHPTFAIFIINEENKAKMQSLEVIEPALEKAQIKLIKVHAKDVFLDSFVELIKEELRWQYQKSFSKSSFAQSAGGN